MMWWEDDCLDRIGKRYSDGNDSQPALFHAVLDSRGWHDGNDSQPALFHAVLDSRGWHMVLEEETGFGDPPEDCMLGVPDVRTFWHDDMCTRDDDELDED